VNSTKVACGNSPLCRSRSPYRDFGHPHRSNCTGAPAQCSAGTHTGADTAPHRLEALNPQDHIETRPRRLVLASAAAVGALLRRLGRAGRVTDGMASVWDLWSTASARALRKKAAVLRPSTVHAYSEEPTILQAFD
jgi:hypothetical protein